MEIEEDTSQNPRTPRVHPWCQDFCAEMELLDMTNKKRGLSWVIGGLIASSASLMGIASHISRPEVDRIFLVDCFLGKCQNSVSTPWNIQTRWLCFFFGKVLEMVNVLSEICMTGRVSGFPMISDDFCQLHWFLATFFWRVSICFYAQHRDAAIRVLFDGRFELRSPRSPRGHWSDPGSWIRHVSSFKGVPSARSVVAECYETVEVSTPGFHQL